TTQEPAPSRAGYCATRVDAGTSPEGQAAISTRITFYCPRLLHAVQPGSALATEEGRAGGRCGDIGRRRNCAWELVVPTHAGFHSDGTIDRGTALRKPEQRQGERLFCRGNTGRNPDTVIQDRGSKGDLAHFDTAL